MNGIPVKNSALPMAGLHQHTGPTDDHMNWTKERKKKWPKRGSEKGTPCVDMAPGGNTWAAWQSAPRLFRFPCTTPSYLGNNFSAPTDRSILVVSLRFHPLLFQEQTKPTGFQDTRTETSRRRRRRRRVLPLLSRITTNPSAPSPLSIDHLVPVPQAAARHLRRIWFEARREVSFLISGALTRSVRFDLLMRPAGLIVFGCDCCDCFVSLRQAMTLIVEFCSIGWPFYWEGDRSLFCFPCLFSLQKRGGFGLPYHDFPPTAVQYAHGKLYTFSRSLQYCWMLVSSAFLTVQANFVLCSVRQ